MRDQIHAIHYPRAWEKTVREAARNALRLARGSLPITWPVTIVAIDDFFGVRPRLLLDAHASGRDLVVISTRTEFWHEQSKKNIVALFISTLVHELTHAYRENFKEKKTLAAKVMTEGVAYYVETKLANTRQSYLDVPASDRELAKWWKRYHKSLSDYSTKYYDAFREPALEEHIARLGLRIVSAYAEAHPKLTLEAIARTKTAALKGFADILFRIYT